MYHHDTYYQHNLKYATYNVHLVLAACPSAGRYLSHVLQCLSTSFHFQSQQVTVPRLSSVCSPGQTRNRTRKSSQGQVRRGPNPDHPSVQPLFGMVCCVLWVENCEIYVYFSADSILSDILLTNQRFLVDKTP